MNWQDILEYLPCFLCGLFAVIHFIVELIMSYKQNKKIQGICDKCGGLKFQNEVHDCVLSEKQISKLVEFIDEVRKNG